MTSHFTRALQLSAIAIAIGLGGLSLSMPAQAVRQTGGEYNTMYAGLGAKGYDVVSYFTTGTPTKGTDRYVADFGGVSWMFSSAENLALFKASPEKYTPQFGGFCSWGVAAGKLFDVDPVNGWKIVDGKLYMNFNADINATFSKDPASFINKANRNWPTLNK